MNTRTLKKQLRYIVPEIRLALIKENGCKSVAIGCPEDIEQFVEPMRYLDRENFVAFHLTAKNEVSGVNVVSQGTVSSSLVHPREVFKAAILNNASAIIVAHNHPAGSLTPSTEDLEVTETLIKAGKLLGVPVLDHVIVASTGIYSLRENYAHLWG